MCDFFGPDKPIDQVRLADAIRWRESLLTRPKNALAENTVRKSTQVARQVFKRAMKMELVSSNPFDDEDLPVSIGDREKQYIDLNVVDTVLAVMPNNEWKAVLVLARVAGLRVQSEAPLLKWGHVNWDSDAGSLAVYSPKTKKTRRIPLFPRLREILTTLYHCDSNEGDEYILPTLREKSNNWREPLKKMLDRAGIEPWPALFNSLRSSAAIDIAREHGGHLATKWIGHDIKIALKHYLAVTDADMKRANGTPKSGNKSGTESAENGDGTATCAGHSEPPLGTTDRDEVPCFVGSNAAEPIEKGNSEELPLWTILDSNQ